MRASRRRHRRRRDALILHRNHRVRHRRDVRVERVQFARLSHQRAHRHRCRLGTKSHPSVVSSRPRVVTARARAVRETRRMNASFRVVPRDAVGRDDGARACDASGLGNGAFEQTKSTRWRAYSYRVLYIIVVIINVRRWWARRRGDRVESSVRRRRARACTGRRRCRAGTNCPTGDGNRRRR